MTHWNNAFWAMFVVMGALIIVSTLFNILFLDLLLVFIVVAIGIFKLSDEFSNNSIIHKNKNYNESIKYLTNAIDSSNKLNSRINERHESRFIHVDSKRSEIEKKIEDNYDSLAKKIMKVENRMTDVTKAVVHVAKMHEELSKDIKKELSGIDKLKENTKSTNEKLKRLEAKA